MRELQTVQCADGTIHVSEDGQEITIQAAGNSRVPTTLTLTATQRLHLIDLLKTSTNKDAWSVWRQGDDGNAFLVASGLSQSDADAMVCDLELHKHKQLYWASQRQVPSAV